jgi:long-chain acyl-CoA synthetase
MSIAAPEPAQDESASSAPGTIAQLPFFTSGRFPKPTLIGQCRGGDVVYTSGKDLLPLVRDLSLGLQAIGMAPGDRVAIVSESRPEWLFVDFAVVTAGAVTAPIYPTLSTEQIGFILRDSGATIAVVSTEAQLDKVAAALSTATAVHTLVLIDVNTASAPPGVRLVSLAEVSAMGHARIRAGWGVAREFHQAALAVKPEQLATIIYTSGTTAEPKGVMLTHANLIANLTGVLQMLDLSDEDVALSFLPLCHAFERIVSYVYMMTGVSMIFAESIETIGRDLLVVRPTVMSGVPRVFEKLRARINEKALAAPPLKRRLIQWASAVAIARGTCLSQGRALPLALRLSSRIADRLVFSSIRAAIGGRLRYAVSGSAPLDPQVALFFYGLGLPILEGYGLTETSPVLCVMPIGRIRFGTVGPERGTAAGARRRDPGPRAQRDARLPQPPGRNG